MSLVWQQEKYRAECSWAFPWSLGMTQRAVITKDVSGGTKNTTNLLLSCNNNNYCLAENLEKEKADEMVGLIDARSPEVYKLMTANKRSDISPISAESRTEHLQSQLCKHKRAFLTCYLDDPTYLHGISYLVTSYDLDKFLLLTLQFHPGGRYRSMNTTFQVRDTQKTFCFPFLLTCSICSCQTVSPHISGTKSKLRLYTKKVQLRPPKIIVCWLSMVVSIDFFQTWSGTCWRTGLLLNIK
jgi:hypothetical protein